MKLIKFLFISLIAISCNWNTVPKQNPEILGLLGRIQSNATSIYTSPDLSFSGHEADYALINNQIDSLIQIDNPRKKSILVKQDNAIFNELNELAAEHQASGTISTNVQANYNAVFKSFVHARLISETSLKQ